MAYQNELEQMMSGNKKPRPLTKSGYSATPQQTYKAPTLYSDGKTVGGAPVQQLPAQNISSKQPSAPAGDKEGLRHYKDPRSGQIVSTYDTTLPSGAQWVKWRAPTAEERMRVDGTGSGAWVSVGENDKDYIKPETSQEKQIRLAKEAQVNYSKEFRENLPQYEKQLLGQLGQDTSEMINEGTRGIREGAASRGLLYSGMRKGAEGGLRQKASMAMATGAQGIRRGLLSQADKLEAQAIQSGVDIQQNQQSLNDAIYKQALGEYNSEMGAWGSLLQAGGQAAAISIMMSDVNSKKDIQLATNEIKEFLKSIQPYSYEYKDKKNGFGKHYSVMAQDLEKTEIGKSFVIDTPEGKMVDYGKAFGVLLAAISSIDKRLEGLGV